MRFGTRLVDSRSVGVSASPAAAFAPIRRIGGTKGWYFADVLWWLRDFMDLLVGGVGMRRGRRNDEALTAGDALHFWRVEAFEPDRRLSLVAEMKVPGRAWLQFEVEPIGAQPDARRSNIHQTAIFDPQDWAVFSTGTRCIPFIAGSLPECFVRSRPERRLNQTQLVKAAKLL